MDLANTPELQRNIAVSGQNADCNAVARIMSMNDARNPDFTRQWQELANRASEPNPFFEPWFLIPSYDAFGAAHGRIGLLTQYTDGELTGVMPIKHSRDYYGYPLPHRSAWLHSNAFYGAPLVAKGSESAFWQALLEHLDAAAGLSLFLHLPLLEQDGPLDRALDAVLGQSGRQSSIVMRRKRALHSSNLSASEYLARSLSAKHRKELRRQHRRLSELGDLTFDHREDDYALREWTAEFLALEAAGWKGHAGSALASDKAARRFFAETLCGAATADKLTRLALRLDGKPIAMLASFTAQPGSYSFKTAFDERYAAHSPGMQLQIENLAVLGQDGAAWTDSCAAEGHPMIDRLWAERRHLISRNVAIGGPIRRAAFAKMMAYENRQRSAE